MAYFNPGAPPCTKNCANRFHARFSLFYLDNKKFWSQCKLLIFSPLSDESVKISEKWSVWVWEAVCATSISPSANLPLFKLGISATNLFFSLFFKNKTQKIKNKLQPVKLNIFIRLIWSQNRHDFKKVNIFHFFIWMRFLKNNSRWRKLWDDLLFRTGFTDKIKMRFASMKVAQTAGSSWSRCSMWTEMAIVWLSF